MQTNDRYQAIARQLAYIDFERGDPNSALVYLREAQGFFPNDMTLYRSLTYLARKQRNPRLYFQALSIFTANFTGTLRERSKYHRERLDHEALAREALAREASKRAKPG